MNNDIAGEKTPGNTFELALQHSDDTTRSHDPALPTTASGEYRVYKRRWVGLAMLMVMNIVVSWGWLTYAPVSNLAAEWFRLDSESPINWLSTVILFAYAAATP